MNVILFLHLLIPAMRECVQQINRFIGITGGFHLLLFGIVLQYPRHTHHFSKSVCKVVDRRDGNNNAIGILQNGCAQYVVSATSFLFLHFLILVF